MSDHKPENAKSPHFFLCEELLQPNTDKTDGSRTQMWTSHVTQAVVLNNGERPRVFSGYENQIGHISSSYKVLDADCKIGRIEIARSGERIYFLMKEGQKGFLDVVRVPPVRRITENYGYRIRNRLIGRNLGDVLPKGTLMYRSDAYDDALNLAYGVNLRACYISWMNSTYEDGMVISESAAEKLSHTSVTEIFVSVNTNDILLNMYGDAEDYKSFPDVGEEVQDGKLCARRQVNYSSVGNFSSAALRRTNNEDVVFYADGVVSDVEVFCNADPEDLEENECNAQILDYLESQNDIHASVLKYLKGKRHNFKFGEGAVQAYTEAERWFSRDKWVHEGREYGCLILKFTITKENPACVGGKLTNRYGGKGIISSILPDAQMPVDEDGRRPDILLNPLCIMNRLIPSALYEVELSFIADEAMRKFLDAGLKGGRLADAVVELCSDFSKPQGESMRAAFDRMDEAELDAFLDELARNGVPIHQPPFYGNVDFEGLGRMYDKYDVRPRKFFVPREDGGLDPIETPLVCGDAYMVCLKHHPIGKFSARSARHTNIKGIPSKSRDWKEHQHPYSTTPVRVGEQELVNLMSCSEGMDELFDFLSMHSHNSQDRMAMIRELLSHDEVVPKNIMPARKDGGSQTLMAYFRTMGMRLERSDLKPTPEMDALASLDE